MRYTVRTILEVLKDLELINPAHLTMTSNGHGEFPNSYKLTDKGVEVLEEKIETILKEKSMKRKQYIGIPSVVLLNSEGDILKAFKTEQGFVILDEHRETIATLDKDEIYNFTRGDLELTDSKGKVFNYMEFPGSMKPDLKMLDEFIGVDTTGFSY